MKRSHRLCRLPGKLPGRFHIIGFLQGVILKAGPVQLKYQGEVLFVRTLDPKLVNFNCKVIFPSRSIFWEMFSVMLNWLYRTVL